MFWCHGWEEHFRDSSGWMDYYNKCHISNVLDGTEVTTMWKIQILKFYSNSEKSDSECQ